MNVEIIKKRQFRICIHGFFQLDERNC